MSRLKGESSGEGYQTFIQYVLVPVSTNFPHKNDPTCIKEQTQTTEFQMLAKFCLQVGSSINSKAQDLIKQDGGNSRHFSVHWHVYTRPNQNYRK